MTTRWQAALVGCLLAVAAASPLCGQDAPGLWLEGRAALAAGRWEEARSILTEFAEQYPEHPRISDVCLELARLEPDAGEAERRLREVTREFPRTEAAGEAFLLLAQAELTGGEFASAAEHLEELEQWNLPVGLRREALLVRGEAFRHLGENRKATQDLSRVLELEPDGHGAARALLGLAAVGRARSDLRGAEVYLSEAFARHPRGDLAATILWQWARSLVDQGFAGRGRELLEQLAERFPHTAESVGAREAVRGETDWLTRGILAAESEEGAPRGAPDPRGEMTLPSTPSDTVDREAADTAAVDTSVVDTLEFRLEEEEYIVRTGSFVFREDAEHLLRELEGQAEVTLRVVPEAHGEPPFHLEARGFLYMGDALRFASWLEGEAGYLSRVIGAGEEVE